MAISIKKPPNNQVRHGDAIELEALSHGNRELEWSVVDARGREVGELTSRSGVKTTWLPTFDVPDGIYKARLRARAKDGTVEEASERDIEVPETPVRRGTTVPVRLTAPVEVSLQRTDVVGTDDIALWTAIQSGTEALAFNNYHQFIDWLFCDGPRPTPMFCDITRADRPDEAPIPYPDIRAYKLLRAATEAFLECNCGVFCRPDFESVVRDMPPSQFERHRLPDGGSVQEMWDRYLLSYQDERFIPYLYLVRLKLGDVPLAAPGDDSGLCGSIVREKFTCPCLLELIWSYWHEEGMLVQSMNALSMRFQNRRGPSDADPLAALAIDPLRPLGNLLWGYIQDEPHRLSIARRAYEYDYEYGISLLGEAVPPIRSAERRSAFLGAFHALLHRASIFYKEDDDTTMIADAFPLLNALREVHLLLAEGAHNQYGDLPWTSRVEMLMQQWLLARPEFREFLPTRTMVVYPEPWMERVDAMKRLQGWTDTSVRFFHELATFGEQLLLSIRFGNWSAVFNTAQAANWARFWRGTVQWYIHAYQAVTGVDLSADIVDMRQAEQARDRALQPALHLQRRLLEQHRAGALTGGGELTRRAGT